MNIEVRNGIEVRLIAPPGIFSRKRFAKRLEKWSLYHHINESSESFNNQEEAQERLNQYIQNGAVILDVAGKQLCPALK